MYETEIKKYTQNDKNCPHNIYSTCTRLKKKTKKKKQSKNRMIKSHKIIKSRSHSFLQLMYCPPCLLCSDMATNDVFVPMTPLNGTISG